MTINTYGELKNQVSDVIDRLKDQRVTKSHSPVLCLIQDTDQTFEPGITWSDVVNIPNDTPMEKILFKVENKQQAFLPVKAVAVDGQIVVVVKPLAS